MSMIVVIQLVLCSVAMAQPTNILTGPSTPHIYLAIFDSVNVPTTTCLLTSLPITKRDDYTYTQGVGGHKVHLRAATWREAQKTCEEEGGHLAIINSIAESTAITNLLQISGNVIGATGNASWFSIGFHDSFQEGEYITIYGQSLAKAGFTQWATGQPDNAHGGENCGSIHKNGGLNDIRCNAKFGFVCELPNY